MYKQNKFIYELVYALHKFSYKKQLDMEKKRIEKDNTAFLQTSIWFVILQPLAQ